VPRVSPVPQRLLALRRCALAVTVLGGLDLTPGGDGVQLEGTVPLVVSWDEVDAVVGPIDAESAHARRRLGQWLAMRRAVVDRYDLDDRARPVGLPVGHVLHPGPDWVRQTVAGGLIDLGLGFVGLLADPDEVVVVPPGVLTASSIDTSPWWPGALRYLDRMGAVAAERHVARPGAPLRPIGDCDVVTLLASPVFRASICAEDSAQLRSAAVPMRRRGWLDLSRIDPAFAMAAAAATEPAERGFERVVLISPYEVVLSLEGGRVTHWSLNDPPPQQRHHWG
jgi:hypothetical protein